MTTARPRLMQHEVSVGSGSLHVREWCCDATSGAAPLVLLHGFTGCSRAWEQVVALLAYRGRVLAPDLPGHGSSVLGDEAAYEIESVAAALDVGLDALDAPQVVLAGYSMGGRLALYYAITRPVRIARLILESASPGIADEGERATRVAVDEALARYVLDEGIEHFVERWERTPVLATQRRLATHDLARLRELRLSSSPAGLARSLRGMGTGTQPYLGARLGEVVAPTLVIAGEEDAKFSALARTMAASIPAATLAVVPRVGHTPHLEDPARWVEVVGQFINIGRKAA